MIYHIEKDGEKRPFTKEETEEFFRSRYEYLPVSEEEKEAMRLERDSVSQAKWNYQMKQLEKFLKKKFG